MIDRQANANAKAPSSGLALHRRGSVRRRRVKRDPRVAAGRWVAARSRKRMLRTAVLCTGMLLLMAVALYLGLSRQDSAPAYDGAIKSSPVGFRGLA